MSPSSIKIWICSASMIKSEYEFVCVSKSSAKKMNLNESERVLKKNVSMSKIISVDMSFVMNLSESSIII